MGREKRELRVSYRNPDYIEVGKKLWVVFEPVEGARRVVHFHNSWTGRDVREDKQFHVGANDLVPLYPERYDFVDNFCQGLARACLNGKWFHIGKDGKPVYSQRYEAVGSFFDEEFATARDETGEFHIRKDGVPAYTKRYRRVSSFNAGAATASVFITIEDD